jgi:hypothetical protein
MTVIDTTALKLPPSAFDPNRPISSLLKTQVEHFHEAEKRLPSRYHSEIYVNAIKTEDEAAKYIRAVTEAIHAAHKEAAALREAVHAAHKGATALRVAPERKRGIDIAAVTDEHYERQRKPRAVKKSSKSAKGRGRA